mmetsp:Transcript_48077/g.134393  ORF Transcript_48077/g.134393 Transcript_48077/m.134393 type:complete len:202 (+) Transcript_48077:238-843(+)
MHQPREFVQIQVAQEHVLAVRAAQWGGKTHPSLERRARIWRAIMAAAAKVVNVEVAAQQAVKVLIILDTTVIFGCCKDTHVQIPKIMVATVLAVAAMTSPRRCLRQREPNVARRIGTPFICGTAMATDGTAPSSRGLIRTGMLRTPAPLMAIPPERQRCAAAAAAASRCRSRMAPTQQRLAGSSYTIGLAPLRRFVQLPKV